MHGSAILTFLILVLTSVASFITHVVWCINAAAENLSAIALLIVGVVIPPVGVIHGMALWLGFTWI